MSFARAGTAAFLAAALAAGAARGQEGEKKESSLAEVKDSKSADYDVMMKLKYLACRDSGDCKPYMLEKEKANKKKVNPQLLKPEKPLPEKPLPGKPRKPTEENSPLGPSSTEPPEAEASLAEPLEAPGSAAGPAGAAPSAGPPPTAAQAEVRRQEAGERRARTMSRASGAADTMRRSFFPAEEPPPGDAGDAGGPRPGAAPPADEPRTAFRPAEPRTVPEMALAARTGFAATFRDQGLKVGAGPRGTPAIQRLDGAPASEADVERLGAALRSDPAALTRRPDFFEVLPREKFLDLKQDFTARPELRSSAFRDIALTERERDFQWSSSCSGLSGACNPHAGKQSYRKGDDVPPEDLDSVWNAVQEELMGSDDEFGEYTDEERAQAAAEDLAEEKLKGVRRGAPSLASLLARMGDLARGAGESAGLIPARDVPSPPSPASEAAGSEFSRDGLPRAPRGAVATARGDAPSSTPPPPAPAGRRAARSWNLLYVLAAAGAAVLLIRRR